MTDLNSCFDDSFPCGNKYVVFIIFIIFISTASGITGQNRSQCYKLLTSFTKNVGEDLCYECKRNNHVNDVISFWNEKKKLYDVRRTANVTVLLNMKLYEFDNGTQIDCHGQKNNIIVRASKERTSYEIYEYYGKKKVNFQCKIPRQLTDYSLHFAEVDKYNTIKKVKPTYNEPLLYSSELSDANNNTFLICFYYNCEKINNTYYNCSREIIKENSYQFLYINSTNSTEDEWDDDRNVSGILIPLIGVALCVAIVIVFVVIYIYIRRRRLQSQENAYDTARVEYAELELNTQSVSEIPRQKEEILYSEIIGILSPKTN